MRLHRLLTLRQIFRHILLLPIFQGVNPAPRCKIHQENFKSTST